MCGIPYLIVGIALMIFNFVRFGNVFEFGMSYQLTVADQTRTEYKISKIPIGIMDYFLQLPQTSREFPYLITNWETRKYYGYYCGNDMAAGIFILNPIILLLFFIPKIKKYMSKDLSKWTLVFVYLGIFMAIIEILVVGGRNQRYVVDFLWMLLLPSVFVVFSIYKIIRNKLFRKYYMKTLIILTLLTSIVNFLLCAVQGEQNFLKNQYPDEYYSLLYSICFWE